MERNRKIEILLLIIIIFLNIGILHEVLIAGNTDLYQEGAFIENTSAFCYLSGSLILFASALIRSHFRRWLTLFFALCCLTFFLREVDIADINVPSIVKLLGADSTKDMILATGFLFLTYHFLKHYRHLTSEMPNLLKSKIAILTLTGCSLVIIGDSLEKLHWMFLEEFVEMNGSWLIFVAAVIHVIEPESLTIRYQKNLLPKSKLSNP